MNRGEFIIPAPWMDAHHGRVSALEDVIRLFFSIERVEGRQRELRVLSLRAGLDSKDAWTLDEVGAVVDVSKQRVRQIETAALAALGEFLQTGRHVKRRIAADAALRQVLAELAKAVPLHASPLTEGSAAERVSQVFKGVSAGSPVLRIVLWALGFKEWRSPARAGQVSVLWMAGSQEERLIIEASEAIRDTLVRCVRSLTWDELKLRVARGKATQRCPPDRVLQRAIGLCDAVERVDQGFQAAFSALVNVRDRAYRVLYETGKTMAARDIAREINTRVSRSGGPRSTSRVLVTNGLASDPRFKHVGRSEWALAEWDVDTRTIAELLVDALRRAGHALTEDRIWESAKVARPSLRRGSMRSTLSQELFVRNAEGCYELAEWLTSPERERHRTARRSRECGRQEMAREAARILSARTPPELPVTELARELQRCRGIGGTVGALSARVARLPSIEIRRQAHGARPRRIAVAVSDWRVTPLPWEPGNSKLVAIQSTVRQILSGGAEAALPLRQLRDQVLQKLHCPHSSFYEAVRRMPDVRKRLGEGSRSVMCCLQPSSGHLECLAATIRQTGIRAEAERALALLRIDTVDLALFQLGRLFESTLKQYMLEARRSGSCAVSDQDLSRLSRMVDWAWTVGVVKERSALDFLRIARNERAHDGAPSQEERLALLASSGLTAEVYVRYIALLARPPHGTWPAQ